MRLPVDAMMRMKCVRSRGSRLHSGAVTGGGRIQPQHVPLGTTYFSVTGSTGFPGTNAPDLNRRRTFPVVHVPAAAGFEPNTKTKRSVVSVQIN